MSFFDPIGDFVEDNVIDPIQDNVIDPVQDFIEDATDFAEDTVLDPIANAVGFNGLISQFAPPQLVDAQGISLDLETANLEGDVVVLVHGWQSSYATFADLYTTIETKYPDKQVLGLDWSALADLPGDLGELTGMQFLPNNTAKAIAYVAETIADQLQQILDVTGNELTVIGHSLGSLVASEIGRLYDAISDPIEQLIALDPAAFAKSYDLDGRDETWLPGLGSLIPGSKQTVKDFNTVAKDSLALVVMEEANPLGGIAGDNDFATTAHDSFLVDLPDSAGPAEKHNAVISVFNTALGENYFTLEKADFGIPLHIDNLYENDGSLKDDSPGFLDNFLPIFDPAGHEGIIAADLDGTIFQYQPQPDFETSQLIVEGDAAIAADPVADENGEAAAVVPDSPAPLLPSPAPADPQPGSEPPTDQPPVAEEVLDLTGLDGPLLINVTLEREATFDNLLQFYETDATGAIAGLLPGETGYEDAVRQALLESPVLSVANGTVATQAITLTGGTYYAPALLIQGDPDNLVTLDDGALGSDRIQRDGNVWKFEDAADFDFNDLIFTVTDISTAVLA